MTSSISYMRIIMSLGVIAFVAALVVGGTGAFFSDTETSSGNVFAAGDIDLRIGNESYYSAFNPNFNGNDPTSILEPNEQNTFEVGDLNEGQVFFTFTDLKPGDLSEDTITIEVGTNDAYACAYVETTADDDGTCNDPELVDDPTCEEDNDNLFDGELGEQLNFAFWADDGDNVFEDDEQILTTGNGASAQGGLAYALADSQTQNVFDGDGNALLGNQQYHIGKAWCFGELTPAALADEDDGEGPDVRGSGFTCTGAEGADNASQTDVLEGTLSFYAVQERNNGDFVCDASVFDGISEADNRPMVGADLTAYTAPAADSCDITVDGDGADADTYATIQEAVDAAEAGDLICVEAGTYPEDVDVTEEVTIAGLPNPEDVSPALLEGQFTVLVDGVTIEGMKITNTAGSGEREGIFVGNAGGFTDTADVITLRYNLIDGVETDINTTVEGIHVKHYDAGNPIDGVVIANNVIRNVVEDGSGANGMKLQSDIRNITVEENTIEDVEGVWAYGVTVTPSSGETGNPSDVLITRNVIDTIVGTSFDAVAVGVDETTGGADDGDASGAVATFNNFLNTALGAINKDTTETFVAENNWWGDTTPADEAVGDVDFTPFQTTPLPLN